MRLMDRGNGDGWSNGDGCSDPMDDDRLAEMIVGLSPEKFSGDFSGDFFLRVFLISPRWDGRALMGSVDLPRDCPGEWMECALPISTYSVAMMDQIELMLEAIQKRHNDPKDFHACSALAWFRPSPIFSLIFFGRDVGKIDVIGIH